MFKVQRRDRSVNDRVQSSGKVEQFNTSFATKYSILNNDYCVADGLKRYLEQSCDIIINNMFCNIWRHYSFVGNMFVFAPYCFMIACAINDRGAIHGSIISEWGGIYKKLGKLPCTDWRPTCRLFCLFKVAVSFSNKFFPRPSNWKRWYARINCDTLAGHTRPPNINMGNEGLSGYIYKTLRSAFLRRKRKDNIFLLLIVLLFNLRVRLVVINRIITIYTPHINLEANNFLFISWKHLWTYRGRWTCRKMQTHAQMWSQTHI